MVLRPFTCAQPVIPGRTSWRLPFILNCKQENNKDYRFLWLYDGFSRIKSKFIFGGNYDFRRPDTKVSVTFDDKLHIMKVWKNISRYI